MTFKTVAGPLDGTHRSGRATGDHQDPAATLLLHGRTAYPLGAQTHFASATALALGSPVQPRPSPTASHPISCLMALTATDLSTHCTTERPRKLALRPVRECILLRPISLSLRFPALQRPLSRPRCGYLKTPCRPSVTLPFTRIGAQAHFSYRLPYHQSAVLTPTIACPSVDSG